jgi:hypothetical protein
MYEVWGLAYLGGNCTAVQGAMLSAADPVATLYVVFESECDVASGAGPRRCCLGRCSALLTQWQWWQCCMRCVMHDI